MTIVTEWDRLAEGVDCPFDVPRTEPNAYWDSIAALQVSTLCLLKNQAYRGHCILIYDLKHVARPDQLTADEWALFARDAHISVCALMEVCRADHINVECMGNRIPHLHWQVIPRYKNDPRWSGPIWTTSIEDLHHSELSERERTQLMGDLRAYLEPDVRDDG